MSDDARNDWALPGVFEAAPGVQRIPLPLPGDGLKAVNVYAVTAGERVVLIDPGWGIPEARELLDKGLNTLGRSMEDVERFLVTHLHRDHYTQAVQLRREFGTRISLGAGERPGLETMRAARSPLDANLEQLRSFGAAHLAEQISAHGIGAHHETLDDWELPTDWFGAHDVVRVGERMLDVIPTPGHTRGHVVFHDTKAGLLFTGDHVLPTITPSVGFEPLRAADPLGDFLRSLALLRGRPDAVLLPAHGAPTSSVHRRIDELVDHHGARLEQTGKAVARGADTALAVAGELLWTRHEHKMSDLDLFNQMLAVGETDAHLTFLAAQGRLITSDEEGVRHYATA